ncbi:uncharacterized protein PV09_03238 [Verruconis gallopava]|uniref:Xylanolytic transcriptional activator regulatory domain-containing protein n=1 Tax=Verruconis gallopava TaxID=253628 RepID=A0A0D1XTL3_9PEZI|nr:uncharacterized protein PV09_03238 [Verruconis gallopava]KIW06066.1 hypothetical protein PV09_03238 [Verruconis gallopava]
MMTDIGLHLDPQRLSRYENLTPVDVEARKRLALAAYSWDKVLSLTLGRPPTLSKLWVSVDDIFDDYDDREYWYPLGCENPGEYRAARSYNSATFKQLCLLLELVGPVLTTVASHGRARVTVGQVESIQNRLESWYDQLPSVLRIDDAGQRTICPPPHVLSLNLYYRTLLSILFRPFQQTSSSSGSTIQEVKKQLLAEQAAIMHDLLTLYSRAFQIKENTYLISYCIYTAATVDIALLRVGDDEQRHVASLRLRSALEIIESESRQAPGIKRSVDIIKRQLRATTSEREQGESSSRPQINSRQQSYDQTFALVDPNSFPQSINTSASLQEFGSYTHAGSSQYFGAYGGFDESQAAVHSVENAGWQGGGQHHDPNSSYNPQTFGWNYDHYPHQAFSGGSSMYGWPPGSGMS